jgi:DNA-binding NarL/FixJ family response regulator
MNFYASLIFLGIVLVLFSFIWVIIDKKKAFGFIKSIDSKKQELAEIITDAEQMIEELNKFSDYIVTQMDLKNEELQANFKSLEERVKSLGSKAMPVSKAVMEMHRIEAELAREMQAGKAEHLIERQADKAEQPVEKQSAKAELQVEKQELVMSETRTKAANGTYGSFFANGSRLEKTASITEKTIMRKSDKVIPFNNRYTEVLKLSEEGMDVVDIAKRLGIGKGEIELIMGINRN